MTEQLNFRRQETGTLLEDDSRIDLNVSNPNIMTPEELRLQRERDEMHRRLEISERQAMGLPEIEVPQLAPHQEIGVMGADLGEFRSSRLAD